MSYVNLEARNFEIYAAAEVKKQREIEVLKCGRELGPQSIAPFIWVKMYRLPT